MVEDPVEIISTFMNMLRQPNLSARAIQKIGEFAYQHCTLYDGLFSGLIEVMKQQTIQKRLNLFYTVDNLCKNNQKYNFEGYVEQTQQFLEELVNLVVERPHQGKVEKCVLTNAHNVRKVLSIWKSRDIISEKQFEGLNTMLTNLLESQTSNKDMFWKRVVEDRDKQKKHREESWYQPMSMDGNTEFKRAWEKAKVFSDHDYQLFKKYRIRYDSIKAE
ncbi:hypothetical protein HDV04_000545 [Boothiomyces sp. JEL0838]|nr:hypothetical protein HDV04_000545 [Boothiomyces sp. JEL0838]